MYLGSCPAAQTVNHLVDLHHYRTYIAQVGFHLAAAEIVSQSLNELCLMCQNGLFQTLELPDTPTDRQRCARAEETALGCHNLANGVIGKFTGQ